MDTHDLKGTTASDSGDAPATAAESSKIFVVYFASVREAIGVGSETIELPSTIGTVGDFIVWMRNRGPGYEAALNDDLGIRAAVDRVHATPETSVSGAREIAIFPMMTGG